MQCQHCRRPLNEAQWRLNNAFKSCPKCSTNNGLEHVYYRYPDNFGTTQHRSSSAHPEGPQSHCVTCRSNSTPITSGSLCREL